MKLTDIKELEKIANNIRISIIEQVYEAGSGHPGGALSIADIMAVLYFNQMNIDSKDEKSNLRDRLVLSKGHGSCSFIWALAEKGYIEKEELKTFRKLGSRTSRSSRYGKITRIRHVYRLTRTRTFYLQMEWQLHLKWIALVVEFIAY